MRSNVWLFLLAVVVAGVVALIVPEVVEFAWGQVAFLVMLVVLLMVAGIWFRAEKRLPILCDPLVLFFVFQAQFFVIGPLALPLFNYSAFRVTHEATIAMVCAFLLMLIAFIVGYQMRLGGILSTLLPDFRGGRLKLPGRWVETAIIALSLLGCLGYVWNLGGLAELLRLGYGRGKSSPMFWIPFHALVLGTLLMAWRLMTSRGKKVADLALFAGLLLTELIFFGVLLGVRKNLFLLFFGLLGIWALRQSWSKMPRYVAALLTPPLLAYFSLWGMVRAQPLQDILRGRWSPIYADSGPVYKGYLGGVAEPFAVACLIYNVFPDTEPYRYGQTLLVTLLGFIPRAVWADKPIGLGKDLTRYTDGAFYQPQGSHSITSTLVGDFYANLGWLGVLVGGLVLGVVCRMMAAYAAEGIGADGAQRSAARVLISAVFVAGLVEVRSDMATMLAFYFITYPFLLLSLLFFRFDYDPATQHEYGSPPLPGSESAGSWSPAT